MTIVHPLRSATIKYSKLFWVIPVSKDEVQQKTMVRGASYELPFSLKTCYWNNKEIAKVERLSEFKEGCLFAIRPFKISNLYILTIYNSHSLLSNFKTLNL